MKPECNRWSEGKTGGRGYIKEEVVDEDEDVEVPQSRFC